MSYDRVTKLAIYRLHRGEDTPAVERYMRQLFARVGLANPLRISGAVRDLRRYARWVRSSGVVVADVMARIDLNLGSGITLGGEISRVDIEPGGGYAAILLGKAAPDWSTEFRMPLIQLGVSNRYGRDIRDIRVGVQELDGTGRRVVRFDDAAIAAAYQEAQNLAATLRRLGVS